MCDCYFHKCESCENEVSVHIADFCIPRDALKVFCPDCIHKIPPDEEINGKAFVSKVIDRCQVFPNRKRHIGKTVIFLCVAEAKAYGICVN